MIDKFEIRRTPDRTKWELVVHDAKGKEHKIPNVYNNWQDAAGQLTFVRYTDRGFKVKVPESGGH